jgi:hypothetical protein
VLPAAYLVSLPCFAGSQARTSLGCPQSSLRLIRDSKKRINNTSGVLDQRRTYSNLPIYDNYESITSEVLNNLLVKQQVSITQVELERLKKIPALKKKKKK